MTKPEDVANLINNLCSHQRWYWERVPWKNQKRDGHFLCGLRLKLSNARKISWILGFGPFSCLPFTRRFEEAPFSTLVFRTKSTPYSKDSIFYDPKSNAVHLAHMDPKLPNQDVIQVVNQRTSEDRESFLAEEAHDESAKAKVTFCLPNSVRKILPDPE